MAKSGVMRPEGGEVATSSRLRIQYVNRVVALTLTFIASLGPTRTRRPFPHAIAVAALR